MNFSITNWPSQSTKITRSKQGWLRYLGLIFIVTLSLAACQIQPVTNPIPIDQAISTAENLSQQTAEVWLNPDTQAIVINPTKITDNLSGITIRVRYQPGSPLNQIDISKKPYIVSETFLEQGWIVVINRMTESPEGGIWADLALINTKPEGLAVTDTSTIATLNPTTINNLTLTDSTPAIDLAETKIITKSAQEVTLSIPEAMPSP